MSDYDGLIVALRSRADELQVARETIDEVAGLPACYSGKILGLKQVRRIGMLSLGPLLGALGVKLVMVEDVVALKLVAGRLKKRAEGLRPQRNSARRLMQRAMGIARHRPRRPDHHARANPQLSKNIDEPIFRRRGLWHSKSFNWQAFIVS